MKLTLCCTTNSNWSPEHDSLNASRQKARSCKPLGSDPIIIEPCSRVDSCMAYLAMMDPVMQTDERRSITAAPAPS